MNDAERDEVEDALRRVVDPELGINIVDLGLVYAVVVGGGAIDVTITATSPACPLGEELRREAEAAIRRAVPGVESVRVALVWEPPWTPDRMRADARRRLGWDDGTREGKA
jgi:metal-sulfur cluster biosynthetic enzyme